MAAAGKTLDNVVEELKSINELIDATGEEEIDIAEEQTQLLRDLNSNILAIGKGEGGVDPNTSILTSMNQSIINSLDILKDINSFQTPTTNIIESLNVTAKSSLDVLSNILNLMIDDSAAAREAAREAARAAKGGGADKGAGVKDAKVEEAKAGGFFSKLGAAVMNPMKALGSGLAKMGKGIEGLLTGIARGIMAFANPLVIVGVATLSISLPIFAAGLAAAFKVFDMIMGQGKGLELITGIIESLGKAIGTILHDVLVGFGKMIALAGPGIKLFFDGLATVIKAIGPIVTSIFKIIKDIITDPVFNKTIRAVLKLVEVAIKSLEKVIIAFAPYIESIVKAIGVVVVKVFKIIKDIITDPTLNKTIQELIKAVVVVVKEIGKVIAKVGDVIISVVENIGGIIESVGKAISDVINAIGDTVTKVIGAIGGVIESIGKAISDVITSIGDTVTKVIGAVADLIKTIGDTIVNIIDGVVTGIERLAALSAGNMLAVAAGLTAMAVALALFGAGAAVGAAFMPTTAELESIAKSVEMFGAIDSANLSAVGKGMTDIGIGLAAFGAGGALAALLDPGEGGLKSVAKSVEMFGQIAGDNLSMVGDGMKAVGVGLLAFGAGGALAALLNDPKGLSEVAMSVEKFGTIDGSNFAIVGDGIKKLGVGLLAFGGGGAIGKMASAFGNMFSSEKEDPVEKFQKFAKIGPGLKDASDGIMGLANAFKAFDDADPAKAGKAINEFANSIDPAAIAKLKDSLSGISSEKLLAGGIYKMEPIYGKFETGGIVPATGTYKLHKDEMVVDNNAMEVFKAGTQILSSLQTGQELAGLQRESNQLTEGGGAPIVVNSPSTTQINQNQGPGMILPPSPISPNQSDIPSTLD